MVILRAWIRATRLILGSWKCFTSHPKGSVLNYLLGSIILSSRGAIHTGHYRHMCHWTTWPMCVSFKSFSPVSCLAVCLKHRYSLPPSLELKKPFRCEMKCLQDPRSPFALIQALWIIPCSIHKKHSKVSTVARTKPQSFNKTLGYKKTNGTARSSTASCQMRLCRRLR